MREDILRACRNIETKYDCIVEEIIITPALLPHLRFKVQYKDPAKQNIKYIQQLAGIGVLPTDLYQWAAGRYPDWRTLD